MGGGGAAGAEPRAAAVSDSQALNSMQSRSAAKSRFVQAHGESEQGAFHGHPKGSELAVIPRGRRVPAQQIRLLERPPQATRHRGVHERLILFRLGLVRTARDDARHLRTDSRLSDAAQHEHA